MVREFDFTRDLSCTVIMAGDGIMPAHTQKLDRCCSVARTVCRELTDRGVNVDFYTNCVMEGFGAKKRKHWKCVASPNDQQDLLQGLALISPSPVHCSADVLAVSAARSAGERTAFVLIVPFENESTRKAVRILEEYSNMRVMVILESDLD